MDIGEHAINLERAALDRWIKGDPDGYLGLYASDATYFDPFCEKRVDGLDALTTQLQAIRGIELKFAEPRYEMINPHVAVEGDVAILTFNLINYAKPTGISEESLLANWNATEIYQKENGTWQLIHSHWSFTQPPMTDRPTF